jgi:hypothetical protein
MLLKNLSSVFVEIVVSWEAAEVIFRELEWHELMHDIVIIQNHNFQMMKKHLRQNEAYVH